MSELVAVSSHQSKVLSEPSYTAIGAEAGHESGKLPRILQESLTLATEPPSPTEVRFEEYARRWRAETAFTSSAEDLLMNEWYQRIIALGEPVVPVLLRELGRRPDHWGWALRVITGVNPVPAGAAGDLEQIARAWTRWGRTQGIRW